VLEVIKDLPHIKRKLCYNPSVNNVVPENGTAVEAPTDGNATTDTAIYEADPNTNPDHYFFEDSDQFVFPNLVTSIAADQNHQNNSMHLPVIDIDVPCELIPSSDPNHYHLYIHKPVNWIDYKRILNSLTTAGIVQKGYYNASIRRGFSSVRPIGVVKPQFAERQGSDVLIENAHLRRSLFLASETEKYLLSKVAELQGQIETLTATESPVVEQTVSNEDECL
jgi:hypothetical protein